MEGRSFREQGFDLKAAGITDTARYDLPDRFILSATYGDGTSSSVINRTSFAFGKNPGTFPDYHLVMTVTQIIPDTAALGQFPKARAKVMIGDCMRR